MLRGAIGSLLGGSLTTRHSSANGGAGGAGCNFEVAAELGHALTHARNAHAEACDIGLGWAVGGKLHAATVIDDLQGYRRRVFAETDGGGVAAGMALNVGEAFLNDAEEGDFDGLRQAAEVLGKAKFIEQRRMEKVGEGADFAGHLLQKGAGFFEGAFGGFAEGGGRLTDLSKAQVHGQNGLRHAIVKFAADAAALFVLQLEQLNGELADGLLGVFHLGDIGEGKDDAEDGAVGVELRDGIAEEPKGFRHAGAPPSHGAVAESTLGAKDGGRGIPLQGQDASMLIKESQADV